MQFIQRQNKSVTIFSNTKLREILEFSVYFPSTPSKLKVQVLIFFFISPSILSLWELHALSLYKPLIEGQNGWPPKCPLFGTFPSGSVSLTDYHFPPLDFGLVLEECEGKGRLLVWITEGKQVKEIT